MSLKIKIICLKCYTVFCFLLLLQQVYGQYNFTALGKELEDKKKWSGQNIVALIYKYDTLIFKKETGDFNSKTQAPIASCSKWLTAALVLTFVDEGKISLDDKVSKYLPVFDKYGKSYITIRHCLSHMTGIQSEPIRILKLFERKKFPSLEEEVNAFAAKAIQTNPGTEFRYSNIGLNIAGRVLEVIANRKFDMLMRQRIFVPLGMRNSTFSTLDASALNPSGGAKSTANDYMNFLVMLLNKGRFNGKQILSEEAVFQMRITQTTAELIKYAPGSTKGFNYALGSWVIEQSPLPEGRSMATALTCPELSGTWPMIDFCRGYAYIFFVKSLLDEERAEAHLEIKKIIDNQLISTCK